MKRVLCVLFCIWLATVERTDLVRGYSMIPPTLNITEDELVIDSNDTLIISCRGQSPLQWSWPGGFQETYTKEKDNKVTVSSGSSRSVTEEDCEGVLDKPYCKVFKLVGTRANDTGSYSCHYIFFKAKIKGMTADSIHVFVRDWEQPFFSPPGTLLINKETTIVPCLVSIPDLNVTLYMQANSVIVPDGKSVIWDNKEGMLVPSDKIRDVLFLQCRTIIDSREFFSSYFFVHFTGIRFYNMELTPKNNVELLVGDQLVLNCTVTAEFNTPVNFEWVYPGKTSHRYVIKYSDRRPQQEHTEVYSTITLPNVNTDDLGTYVCQATSETWQYEQSCEVIVHEKPFITVENKEKKVIEATAGTKIAQLSVKVSAYPLPSFQWLKDGKLVPFSNNYGKYRQSQHALQIRDVVEQDAGTYTLVLKNEQAGLEEQISLQLVVNGKSKTG